MTRRGSSRRTSSPNTRARRRVSGRRSSRRSPPPPSNGSRRGVTRGPSPTGLFSCGPPCSTRSRVDWSCVHTRGDSMTKDGRVANRGSGIREHLRSNIVGYVALFVALTGGTAYALDGSNTVFSDDIVNGQVKGADLDSDSVGTPKIIDGGVRSADVLDDTLSGSDINESTLGTVPQAQNAGTLDSQDSTHFGVGIMGGRMNAVTAGEAGNRPPIGLSTTTGSFVAPSAGSFVARDLRISLTSNLGAAQTRSFAFVTGGAATALACTVPANQGSYSDTVDAVTVNSGSQYAIRQTGSTGAPPDVDVQFGWGALSP